MDRVQASEAWGRGFESHAARQLYSRGIVPSGVKGKAEPFLVRLFCLPPPDENPHISAMNLGCSSRIACNSTDTISTITSDVKLPLNGNAT